MVKYQVCINTFTGTQNFIVKDSNIWIPNDFDNIEYQEYLAWLEEGNTPEEWNPNGNN